MALHRAFPYRDPLPTSVHLPKGKERPLATRTEHVRVAYASWKSRYLVQTTEKEYRVRFDAAPDSKTVSEGQGYGMLIAAYMAGADPNAQKIFDGLYRFSRRHKSINHDALMDWQIFFDGTKNYREGSAFDGDADIAYALLLAERQWGEARYRADAKRILQDMAGWTLGKRSHLPLLGDWVAPDENREQHNQWTWRSSDFMPAHFRVFAKVSGDPVWREAVRIGHAHFASLQSRFSQRTGLLPDFIVSQPPTGKRVAPAPPHFLEGEHDGDYSYNACRVPWRLGMDVIHNNAPDSRACLARLMRWADKTIDQGSVPFAPGYRLNGTPTLPRSKQYFSTAFVAPFAVGAATGNAPQEIANQLYDSVHAVRSNYYEDTIGLLCLIALAGAAWNPLCP